MGKSRNARKEQKKKPKMSMKERKQAKRDQKSG